jgi:hypothetical protein
MKKKYFAVQILIAIANFLPARALAVEVLASYECHTVANPRMELLHAIHVWVAPPEVSGQMIANAGQASVGFGIVMEVENIKRGDTRFEILQNIYHSFELSAVSDFSKVSRIVVYTNHAMYDDESSVLRYFEGSRQVGGTLVIRGSPTSCVP